MLRCSARHCLQRVEDAGLPCTEMHPVRVRGGLASRRSFGGLMGFYLFAYLSI
jgi:hypothetical protein